MRPIKGLHILYKLIPKQRKKFSFSLIYLFIYSYSSYLSIFQLSKFSFMIPFSPLYIIIKIIYTCFYFYLHWIYSHFTIIFFLINFNYISFSFSFFLKFFSFYFLFFVIFFLFINLGGKVWASIEARNDDIKSTFILCSYNANHWSMTMSTSLSIRKPFGWLRIWKKLVQL